MWLQHHTCTGGPVKASNSATHLTVLSDESDTQVRPSGLMATVQTRSEWPSSVAFSRPVAMSHCLCKGGVVWCGVVWARRGWLCYVCLQHHTCTGGQVQASNSAAHLTVLSFEPDTQVRPSGLMATART